MDCKKCGASLSEGSLFCSHCGTKVESATAAPTSGKSWFTPAGGLDDQLSGAPEIKKHGDPPKPPVRVEPVRPIVPPVAPCFVPAEIPTKKRLCHKCGAEISNDSDFCSECGFNADPNKSSRTTSTLAVVGSFVNKYKNVLLIAIAAVFVIVLLITAVSGNNADGNSLFGQTSTVSEQLVQSLVQKKFGSNYTNLSVDHNPDTNLHTDTVTIVVSVPQKYCVDKYETSVTYQFYKSDDIWQLQNEPSWKLKSTEYKSSAYLGSWEGTFKGKGKFSVNVTSVDFNNGKISGTFTGSISSISFGGIYTHELDATGTYKMTEERDGWEVEIIQDGYAFVFELSKYYGFLGVTVYNSRTGYGI